MKKLYQLLEDEHKMYGANIKPKQALGTRWIDLKMNAMRQIIDKYGLCVSDLQNGIADTSKKVDKTTVKGKLTKLCNANGLLCCASCHSHTSNKLQFRTQKFDGFVVDIFDMAETTCTYFVTMVENLRKNPDLIFEKPTLKSIIMQIEEKNSEMTNQFIKIRLHSAKAVYKN